jgi:hypothetical protein
MSYQTKLNIEYYDHKEERMSPLIFGTLPECVVFGNAMFEPPQTVTSWECTPTRKKPNATISQGKVRMI